MVYLQLPHHTDATSQMLYHASVEVCEDDWLHAKLLQSPQEEEPFPGCFDHLVCVSRPGEVITDMHPEEPEAADPFNLRSVDV